ncbi:hypothetical protein MKX03_014121 [Papaver bracteatum]|nr:hypothetical protein MKX03_014121 [Papaver bracteatum]
MPVRMSWAWPISKLICQALSLDLLPLSSDLRRRRTEDYIKLSSSVESVDQGTLCDQEDDALRIKNPEWLIVVEFLWFDLSMPWISLRHFRQNWRGPSTKEPGVPVYNFLEDKKFFMLFTILKLKFTLEFS